MIRVRSISSPRAESAAPPRFPAPFGRWVMGQIGENLTIRHRRSACVAQRARRSPAQPFARVRQRC